MEKKGFGSRLLRKYRLTIHNENKLKNVLGFYISPLWVIMSLFISFMLVAGVLYLVIIFTPVGRMLPGYMDEGIKDKIVTNNLRVDSLMHEIEKQDIYLANIRSIMSGDRTLDSLKNSLMPVSQDSINIETTELETRFVNSWEERERYNLTSQAASVAALQELNLFRPTKGEIIKSFDPSNKHYGVDIAEISGENIVSIHDGIVVFSDYTANDGYTIVLQHRENLISIYRNCYRLLKQVGDKVYGGEVIGTLSNGSGEENEKEKNFLHLELWHRSKPLDPNIYIPF
ncbi:MAG: M23 family metallopeptidase [Bacteroidaceae bacterium]|nr:M23 family metallopeptidase [Bacteroidaceae bacterium]